MASINHIGFIVASYAAAVAVVGALTAWVMIDYRAQRRWLSELERSGVVRRSGSPRSGPALEQPKDLEQAKEKA